MIVTISGKPGSGKSTVARELARLLNFKLISTGDLRGRYAQEHGLTIDELNASTDPNKHRWVDDLSKSVMHDEDNLVLDSWLAWFFAPKNKPVLKVFIDVDLDVAARRIFDNQRPDEAHQSSVSGVKAMIDSRLKNWRADVIKLYGNGADFLVMDNYDLVIDSSELSVEQIVLVISKAVLKFQNI